MAHLHTEGQTAWLGNRHQTAQQLDPCLQVLVGGLSADAVEARRATGVTHLCMRTLGGELDASGHLEALGLIGKRLDSAVDRHV